MNAGLADAPAVPLLAGDEWWSPDGTAYAPVFNASRAEISGSKGGDCWRLTVAPTGEAAAHPCYRGLT